MLHNNIHSVLTNSYDIRSHGHKKLRCPTSVFDRTIIVFVLTAFFVACDYACLRVSWNAVQSSSKFIITLIALSSAVVLDVPPAIAASKVKEYRQGLLSKKSMLYILIPSIVCLLLVISFSFGFKWTTRTKSFHDSQTTGGLVSTTATTTEGKDSESVQFAALFSAILPLCTSLASAVVAFSAADPKGTLIKRLEYEKIRIESDILDLNQAIKESKDTKSMYTMLIYREKDLFDQFTDEVLAVEQKRKQAANQALEEHLNTPDAVGKLTEHSQKINQSYDCKPSEGLIRAVNENDNNIISPETDIPEIAKTSEIYQVA